MTKKGGPRPAPEVTAAKVGRLADQLGLSNERERRRLLNWLRPLVEGFYRLENDRAARVTKRQRLAEITTFKKAATALAEKLGWARAVMRAHEADVLRRDKSLRPEQQIHHFDASERTLEEEIRLVTAGINGLLRRMEDIEVALQKHGLHPLTQSLHGKVNSKSFLVEGCLGYWKRHLQSAKVNQEEFVVGVFAIAQVEISRDGISREEIRTLLQRARRNARAEQARRERAEPEAPKSASKPAIADAAAWREAVAVALTEFCNDAEWARERVDCRWQTDNDVDVGSDPDQAAEDEWTKMLAEHDSTSDAG